MPQHTAPPRSADHELSEALSDGSTWYRHLRQVADSVADGIVIADSDCCVRHVNPAAERIFGHTREQLIGTCFDDPLWRTTFSDEALLVERLMTCQRALQGGHATPSIELSATRPDASTVALLVSACALRDDSDCVVGVVTTFTDITSLKQTESTHLENDEYNNSLLRLYAELGLANSYSAIARALGPEMQRMLGYNSVGLLLYDPETDSVRMPQSRGSIEQAAEKAMALGDDYHGESDGEQFLVLPLGDDVFMREILEATHIVVVDDARTDPRTDKRVVEVTGNRTIVNVPLILAGENLGALNTGTFGDEEGVRPPTPRQMTYLNALSNHVAVAMDRVRFLGERRDAEEALQHSLLEVEAALDGVVTALSLAAGERDPYTALHQERVAKLACAIAIEMGLPDVTIEGIRIAGVLHDIGKISVPAEILSKPSKLSEMEFAIVRSHSSVGHRLLESVPLHGRVATIVLQHHERLDGSGYPDGLHADDILLEAKVLAVADVVEAMASHRPYRPALGLDAAVEEIERGSGERFDSDVVEACVKVLRDSAFSLG